MNPYLLVFLGGGLGSMARFAIALQLKSITSLAFPWQTFGANIIGCLFIGLLMSYLLKHEHHWAYFLLVSGFCGGFTTFSTFSMELINLLYIGRIGYASIYLLSSLASCLAATGLGFWSGRILLKN